MKWTNFRSVASTVRSPVGPVSVRRTGFGFAAAVDDHAARTARAVTTTAARALVAQQPDVDQRGGEDIDAAVVVLGIGGGEIEAGPPRGAVARRPAAPL